MAYILEKIGNTYNLPKKYFTCDAKSDLDGISLVDVPIGSEAYCILEEESYILDSNKQWHKKKIGEDLTGQVQADLSQTDSTQADYVKGTIRQESLPEGYPYKGMEAILDGTFEFADGGGGIYMHQIADENFIYVNGKSYTIIWDGETYQCTAIPFQTELTLGNLGLADVGADTGEPFLFVDQGNGQKVIATTDTAATHTITVSEKIIHPIASEFLPLDSTPTAESINPVTSNGVKNALDGKMSLIVINVQMPKSADWISITYGNGKFVAIAQNSNKFAYSEDGINWTSSTISSSTTWASVIYGNGKFVAVARNSDQSAYSEDGINWTLSTMPSSTSWSSVTYGNGKFVAVTYASNQSAYSEDGINWTVSTMPSSDNWESVTYGNGKFVAVAYHSNQSAHSEDGINWDSSTMSSSANWTSVTYGNGKFVAVARNSDQSAYSEDGINWTLSTMPSSAYWRFVTYGNGKFIAIAYGSDKAAYSEDGVSWISSTMPNYTNWTSVTYSNGKFIAVINRSDKFAYSYDGITWKNTIEYLSQNNSNITEDVRSIIGIPSYSTANNGQFLRVIDGIPTWTESLPTLTSPNGTKYQLTVSDDGTLSAVAQS